MTIFLDTCIFEYAQGKASAYKDPCLNILRAILDGKIISYTDTEVFQEVWYRHYKKDKDKGIGLVEDTLKTIKPDNILPVTYHDITLAIEFGKKYGDRIEPRDTLHLAVMIRNKISIICSVDKGIKQVKEITAIDPIDLAKQLKKGML